MAWDLALFALIAIATSCVLIGAAWISAKVQERNDEARRRELEKSMGASISVELFLSPVIESSQFNREKRAALESDELHPHIPAWSAQRPDMFPRVDPIKAR